MRQLWWNFKIKVQQNYSGQWNAIRERAFLLTVSIDQSTSKEQCLDEKENMHRTVCSNQLWSSYIDYILVCIHIML